VALDSEIEGIKEILYHIRVDPVWHSLWEHLLNARQDCLIKMVGATSWEEVLLIRGEFNAINVVLEWGDTLAMRLEEAERSVEVDNGRFGRDERGN